MRPLQPREQRTIRLAVVVSATSLALAYGVVPFVSRWRAREELIAARQDELARMRAVITQAPALRRRLALAESATASSPRRILSARTAALAASELQASLRRSASAAPLAVSSLDVSGEPDSTAAGALPASLTALGDLQAVSAFLAAVRRGPYVLEVSELRLRPNPSLYGQPLQLSLSFHAPWVKEPGR